MRLSRRVAEATFRNRWLTTAAVFLRLQADGVGLRECRYWQRRAVREGWRAPSPAGHTKKRSPAARKLARILRAMRRAIRRT